MSKTIQTNPETLEEPLICVLPPNQVNCACCTSRNCHNSNHSSGSTSSIQQRRNNASTSSSSTNRPTLYDECQLYIAESILAYLYSFLREMSDTGYTRTPFKEFALPCDHIVENDKNVTPRTKAQILRSALLELRIDKQHDGLFKEVTQAKGVRAVDPSILSALDDLIRVSLKDSGAPVTLCSINAKPFAFDLAKHQHVGSSNGDLCSKYGLHYSQVLIDHLLITEKEKQEKEAKEAPLRKNNDNVITKYAKHFLDIHDENITKDKLAQDEQIIEKLQDDKDCGTSSWLRSQFHPDSPLGKLMDPSVDIVWTNDRYPEKECVYLMVVNKKEKKVVVIFRGTATVGNILADLQTELANYPNPISTNDDDKTIETHHGISEYLFRKRLDNGKTKYDEILEKVNQQAAMNFGKGTSFQLVVTGHSLGGSLATLFGFYASADKKLEDLNGPVRIFSYCSNMVGGVSFCQAFARQEMAKKLYHIRVTHTYDVVPRLPQILITNHASGTVYYHTGLNIELPDVVINRSEVKEVRGSIKVKYLNPFLTYWQFLLFRIMNFFGVFKNLAIWKVLRCHSLFTHYESLAMSHEYMLSSVLEKSLEEVYEDFLPDFGMKLE